VSEDDVKFIVEYTGVSYEKAREALIKAKGDIAKAIMMLTSGESKQ
jgi:nascent polypeptide-associated complex subunit alpha